MYVFGAPNLSIYKSHAFAVLDYVVGPPLSLSLTLNTSINITLIMNHSSDALVTSSFGEEIEPEPHHMSVRSCI